MEHIATTPRPRCPVCDATGNLEYGALSDELFGTAGTWNVFKCPHASCSTLWLNPSPKEDELPKLYRAYSTHEDAPASSHKKSGLLDAIRAAYLSTAYGYGVPARSGIGNFAYLHPAWRDTQAANIFYLPYKKEGVLLDVGCGAGAALVIMERMGWKCVGIDFDGQAVENAKKKGLDVTEGDLFSKAYPDKSFDAVLMNHVIEHVPDPLATLTECRRILRSDGTLVAFTPNTKSRGHERFKRHWRGLEVPQHLQLFSVASLKELAHKAGFTKVQAFSSTQGMLNIYDASRNKEKSGSFDTPSDDTFAKKLIYHVRWFLFGLRRMIFTNRDEVAVIICRK